MNTDATLLFVRNKYQKYPFLFQLNSMNDNCWLLRVNHSCGLIQIYRIFRGNKVFFPNRLRIFTEF